MNFRGCRTKPGPKIRKDQAARPLAGAEVLVAVGGPSPPSRGKGKTVGEMRRGSGRRTGRPLEGELVADLAHEPVRIFDLGRVEVEGEFV